MAICTSDYTFRYFAFCLSNAFCITDIKRLLASNMVKVQSGVMGFIATINTALFHFIIPKPLANLFSSIISLLVNSFSVAWACKPSFSHFLALYRVIFSIARPAISYLNFVWISFTPSLSSFSLPLFLNFCFHNHNITSLVCCVNSYPCKPDIFAETYELVEE